MYGNGIGSPRDSCSTASRNADLLQRTEVKENVHCVAYGKIIVELKALDKLTSREEAQVLNYLKASGFEVGILINFGGPSLEFKRIVRTERGAEPVDLQAGIKTKFNSRKFA